MIKEIKSYAKKLGVGISLAYCLMSSSVRADESWANMQPAYNITQHAPTVRIEGGSTLVDQLKLYSYADVDAPQKPTNFETFYTETRLSYSLGRIHERVENIGIATEYNGGTGLDGLVRFGVVYTPNIHTDNFTLVKVYPLTTTPNVGAQLCIFSSYKFTDWLSASVLVDANTQPRLVYSEQEVDFTYRNSALFGQSRVIWPVSKRPEIQQVVGVKYTF